MRDRDSQKNKGQKTAGLSQRENCEKKCPSGFEKTARSEGSSRKQGDTHTDRQKVKEGGGDWRWGVEVGLNA